MNEQERQVAASLYVLMKERGAGIVSARATLQVANELGMGPEECTLDALRALWEIQHEFPRKYWLLDLELYDKWPVWIQTAWRILSAKVIRND